MPVIFISYSGGFVPTAWALRLGNVKDRLRGTAAQGRVLAKTGTVRLANALAGYLTASSGEHLAFAILLNNHPVPSREAVAALDEIVRVLVSR